MLHHTERRAGYAISAKPGRVCQYYHCRISSCLNLNLPRRDGHEVLEEGGRRIPTWKVIPVVVLTTSEAEQGPPQDLPPATCLRIKPIDLAQFIGIVHAIEGFWFSVVKLRRWTNGRTLHDGASGRQVAAGRGQPR